MITSINPKEIEHFSKDAGQWWDENGPFSPLHRLNPVRLAYLCGQIRQHYGLAENDLKPFGRLKILDIGCGGGLVCEPLARLGAKVTGIDADEKAIAVAKEHAAQSGLDIDYRATTSEDLLSADKKKNRTAFDVVLALEIIEHVNDVDSFVKSCVNLCKKDGLVIFSTLNRTPHSFAMGIVAAEYILRWVPRGTHQWKKFVRPSELARAIRRAGAKETDIKGIFYNALDSEFKLSDDVSVNYMMMAVK